MANISSAQGEITLFGDWRKRECELLNKVFENSWSEQYDHSHSTQWFINTGDIVEGVKEYDFYGCGRWSFSATLYELANNRSYHSIEAGFLSEADYNELIKTMFDKGLAIRFEYVDYEEGFGFLIHELVVMMSNGKWIDTVFEMGFNDCSTCLDFSDNGSDDLNYFADDGLYDDFEYDDKIDAIIEEAYNSIGKPSPSRFSVIVNEVIRYVNGISLVDFSGSFFKINIEMIKEDIDYYRENLEASHIVESVDQILKELDNKQREINKVFKASKQKQGINFYINRENYYDLNFQDKLEEISKLNEEYARPTSEIIKSLESLSHLIGDGKEYDEIKDKIVRLFEKI